MDIRFVNVGIAVRDLDAAVAFLTDLGMTLVGTDEVRGEWADVAVGLDGNHARIAMLRTPSGDGELELFQPLHPAPIEREPAVANEIGMHRVAFQVDDLEEAIAVAARHGAHPLRGVARYRDAFLLTYLRGPSDILVMLAQDLQRDPLPS
ncbi:VOC family protein [Agrococcus sp. SGAir0287]|uniref:VOC family protein n=1 Tax=Agrococcus sp. SGAir0287 TaxID=2070347 RepID=UPI0010CCC1D5|nr:VOC family protein [Agrococcus sp. SGAir0287]QCR20509.1 glyoxalase [Agrococcus sp. SGAir0287]